MKTNPRRKLTLAVMLLAVPGCRADDLEPVETYDLGREIIETFAAHVGEDVRVRDEILNLKYGLRERRPDIADAIAKYVEEAGISYPAWTGHPLGLFLAPEARVPGVINFFVYAPLLPHGGSLPMDYPDVLQIDYGGIHPGCTHVMKVERLDGRWSVGEPEAVCTSSRASDPWKLVDGKWVLDR